MKKLLIFLAFTAIFSAQNPKSDSVQIKQIFDYNLTKGEAYEWLRSLCKDVGNRLSGSPEAAKAVEWSENLMNQQGFDKVWLQETMVPHWVRGEKEICYYTDNGKKNDLSVTALGGSVATPKSGVEAEVVEVGSLDELKKLGNKVAGKIVFINQKMDPTFINTFSAYGKCGEIRYLGASIAGPLGAKAVLTRSLTTEIDDFPHTGMMKYADSLAANQRIPAASISTWDSETLSRALKENPKLKVYLKQNCETLPDVLSYNVIGEIKGSTYPDEIITIGGHLDSWDVGEGAHDDGAGVVQSLEVLKTFKALGIQPKHTLRVVFFMNEENGVRGGNTYAEKAKQNGENHIAALESDAGGHTPRGFSLDTKNEKAQQTVLSWKNLLHPYGLDNYNFGYAGTDIHPLGEEYNIVLSGYLPDSQRYFDYHHTDNDIFEHVNRRELLMGSASMASFIYLLDKYYEDLMK